MLFVCFLLINERECITKVDFNTLGWLGCACIMFVWSLKYDSVMFGELNKKNKQTKANTKLKEWTELKIRWVRTDSVSVVCAFVINE